MLAKIYSCALIGLEGTIVEVEVDISPGLPFFAIVGLPDAAVSEAKERVRSAVRNSGFVFPMKHICANLAPADLKSRRLTTCRLPSACSSVRTRYNVMFQIPSF